MQKIRAFVPHLFTLGNLFCGCLGIIYAFDWRLDWAAYMVFLAAFLDFFDGFFARILKVPSELGKQLDSLADVVSFGVVPGVVMYQYLKIITHDHLALAEGELYLFQMDWFAVMAIMIPVFSCYRLAKFNLDTRQTYGFIGLPTPANAVFFVSLVLIVVHTVPGFGPFWSNADVLWDCGEYTSSYWETRKAVNAVDGPQMPQAYAEIVPGKGSLSLMLLPVITNKYVVVSLIVLFSFLLVSPLPLFALKFKNFGWKGNKIRYIFLVLSAGLLICFWLTAIPFIVILYLLLSMTNNIFKITV